MVLYMSFHGPLYRYDALFNSKSLAQDATNDGDDMELVLVYRDGGDSDPNIGSLLDCTRQCTHFSNNIKRILIWSV